MNTQVQHGVNTVEVETPKIVKEAVRGKKVIREKINQIAEHIKNPQIQFSNKVDEMPVVVQRQNPMVQTVQKTKEIPQLWCVDEVVGIPVGQVSRVQVLEKTAEIPQLQTVEKIAETPQAQTIQGTQAPESSGITPVCQVAQTGHLEELVEVSRVFSQDTVQQRFGKQTIEIPTESESPIFVAAPILENSPAECMKPTLTVTCAHAAPVVENATVQLPQEIVYEHPAPLTSAAPGVTNRQVGEKLADDVISEMKDLKSDLVHIRELLGFLVRKERCAETKAEIAARRLDRMEREQHEADDAEHEANFQEALQNQSKAVKVLVDKWFVDKGFLWLRESPYMRNRVRPRQRRARC